MPIVKPNMLITGATGFVEKAVMKLVNEPEVEAVVCTDEKFCKNITFEGFSVINPIIGNNS